MPISCDPEDLASASKCFLQLPWLTRKAIRIYLLCAALNGETVDCDPAALASAAKCFLSKLSAAQMDSIETYLLCSFAGGGGALQEVFSGNYGGGVPTDTPLGSAAVAYDLDAPNDVWYWDGAAWGP